MYTYHYVRMHGWTGACKRHVSVYDSAYVHKFRSPRTPRRASALQKSRCACERAATLARGTAREPVVREFVSSPVLAIET